MTINLIQLKIILGLSFFSFYLLFIFLMTPKILRLQEGVDALKKYLNKSEQELDWRLYSFVYQANLRKNLEQNEADIDLRFVVERDKQNSDENPEHYS